MKCIYHYKLAHVAGFCAGQNVRAGFETVAKGEEFVPGLKPSMGY